MATRRPKREPPPPPPTVELDRADFVVWLRDLIGTNKQEAFAVELGVSRQSLSGVLTGRRAPSARMLNALRKHGFVRDRRVYVVVKPKELTA